MRIRCVLVAAALCACGGDDKPSTPATKDAGVDASKAQFPADAGKPPRDAGKPVSEPEAGSGGAVLPVDAGKQPSGGMAVGGTGGKAGSEPPPEGGKGGQPAQPAGGSAAPSERVLWSQDWTVGVHDAVAYGAAEGDTMGMVLDAGPGCVFGLSRAAPSGESQTFDTDGNCITEYSSPTGFAAFFSAAGKTSGHSGSADLVGWKTAVAGHTVKYLRRSQTYTIQLLGSDNQRWNYADFTGKWEAVGF